jgi:hypothetical protein
VSLEYKGWMAFSSQTTPTNPPTPQLPLCASIMASVGLPAVAVGASFAGALALNASLSVTPPDLTAILALLTDFQAQATVAIGLGLPSFSYDLSLSLQLVAQLEAALVVLLEVEALLALPVTIPWMTYVGPGTTLGATVIAEPILTPITSAIVLAAVDIPTLTSPSDQVRGLLNGLTFPSSAGTESGIVSTFGNMSPVTINAMPSAAVAIQSQLDVALKIAANPVITPPSLSVTFDAVATFAAHLRAAAALALPKVDFALDATAKLSASILASVGQAILDLGLALLPTGMFFVYTWTGASGAALGTDITLALAGGTWGDGVTPTALPSTVAVLGAYDPVSAGALFGAPTAFFGGVS